LIYLVRHAHAGRKETWAAPDALRPLSEPGRHEAAGLVATLSDLPVTRILSSPTTRCLQTVEPLARQRRLPIEVDDLLGVEAEPARALKLIDDRAIATAVLCSHGELIGRVMEQLVADGLRPAAPLRWAKGSTWVLDWDGDGALRASYLRPVRLRPEPVP
jgi:phosphohistidine phosphatase SixA